MKKHHWKKILILLVVAVVVAGAVHYFAKGKETVYNETEVKSRTIETYYSFTGNLEPGDTASVYASTPNKLKTLKVAEGDLVEEDQVLFKSKSGGEYKAPIAGTVTDIYYEEDDGYTAGAEILRIADYAHPQIRIKVDEYDVSALKTGTEVDVYVQALDQTLTGVVDEISREATVSSSIAYYEALISVPQDGSLYMGMTCEVTLLRDQAKDVPALPIDLLKFDEAGEPYVLCYNRSGEVESRYLSLGINNGTYVEIKSGLRTGDTVLVPQSKLMMMGPMAMMQQ